MRLDELDFLVILPRVADRYAEMVRLRRGSVIP
jgi:hypothetical protein